MAKREYSEYQKKIISNYYKNLDQIALGRLQELVGELYLADSPRKGEKLWQRVRQAMEKMEVPQPIIEHILSKKDPAILAKNIEDWLRKQG
jgi:uncharacterized protein YaaW (UPF0174 family)